ncbi:MAG: hypothetical protein GWP15_02145 [Nitrospirae bacterium]|nr:hypothetical protein [Nitrospirota bacterium]
MKLPTVSKLVMVGSFIAVIGVFLPWYNDIDKYGFGDMFLGISGPLYLAGIIVLLSGIASFSMIAFRLFDKPVPKLPLKENQFYVFSSSVSLTMLVLSISVFFHNSFGVSLVDKSIGVGLYLGLFGSGIVMLGAIIALRNREISFDVEGNLEPLIDVNEEHRKTQPLDEAMKVKSAVQDSIDEFTSHAERDSTQSADTKDIQS